MAYGGSSGSGGGKQKNALDSFYGSARKAAQKKQKASHSKGIFGSWTDPFGAVSAIKDTAAGVVTLGNALGETAGWAADKGVNAVFGGKSDAKLPITTRVGSGLVNAVGETAADIGDVASGKIVTDKVGDIPVYGDIEKFAMKRLNPLNIGGLAEKGSKNARDVAESITGEKPRKFWERAQEHGLASPIVQDVGIVAGGAGAAKGLLKGAARAAEATPAARAAAAGEASGGAAATETSAAVRFAAKARDIANSEGLHNLEHPYKVIGHKIRPLFRAANKGVSEAAPVAEAAGEATKAAPVEPEVPEGMVRLYHGNKPPNTGGIGIEKVYDPSTASEVKWASTRREPGYESYEYVDVPKGVLDKLQSNKVYGDLTKNEGIVANHYQIPLDSELINQFQEIPADPAEVAAHGAHAGAVRGNEEPTLGQQYRKWAQSKGIDLAAEQDIDPGTRLTPEARADIADAYDSMPDDPNAPVAPEAVASYMSLHNDTRSAYDFITAPKEQGGMGVQVDYHNGDHEYGSVDELKQDLANGHLWVRSTHGAGDTASPLMSQPEPDLVMPDGSEGLINDKFRAVHDVIAHSDAGNDFGRGGEEIAFQKHVQTVSPASRPALAMETRGQNSSLIEGGEFPPQRVGVLPEEMSQPEYGIGRSVDEPPEGLSASEREDWLDDHMVRDKVESLDPDAARAARLRRLQDTAGPEGKRIIAAANEPIPQWATDLAGRFGPRTLQAFSRFEGLIEAMETRRIMSEQRRFAEAARRRALASGPVRSAIKAGQKIIEAHGDVSRAEAEALVHQYVERNATGTGDILEKTLGVSEETLAEVGTPGYKKIIPKDWLVDANGEATPLKVQLDDAVNQYRALEQQAYDTLTNTRIGDKGLEQRHTDDPRLSVTDARRIKQAQNLLARADKKRGGQVARDIAATRSKIAAANDEVASLGARLKTNEARIVSVLESIDDATGYVPPAFKNGWTERAAELAQKVLSPEDGGDGGFTFNPHTGEYIEGPTEAGRFAVGAVPETARVVPVEQFRAQGAQIIDEVARGYMDMFKRDDIMLGGWLDNETGMVHIDPSQLFHNRDEAILSAQARGQKALWDFDEAQKGNFGKADITVPRSDRPDIAARLLKSKARTRYARQARRVAEDQATRLERVGLNPETANITPEKIDQHMSLMDNHAVQAVDAGVYSSPDEFFKHVAIQSRLRPPASPGEALAQTFLNRKIEPALWDDVQKNVKDLDKAMSWYYDSHNAIEKRFRGKTITLADGVTKVDAADLMYDLVAVTSINAAPNTNLGNALFAMNNLTDHISGGKESVKAAMDAFDEFFRLPPKKRSMDELFHTLTEGSHMYKVGKKAVFEILAGHTMDTWDTDYLRTRNADFWGGNEKALSMKNVPQELIDDLGPERAVVEHHGSDAWAKILSFRENLKSPATSNAVTLDSWMARLFGVNNDGGWGSKGDYAKFSRQVREMAAEVSARMGRDVRPHEIQAALWTYAKRQISHQNVGRFLAAYQDAIEQMDSGNYAPASTVVMGTKGGDPIADYILEDLLPAREQAKKGAPTQILAAAKRRLLKRGSGIDEETSLTREQAKNIIAAQGKNGPVDTKKFELRQRTVGHVDEATGERTSLKQTFQPDYLPKKLEIVEGQWRDYQKVRADMYDRLAAGDVDGAKRILTKYANLTLRQIRDEAAGSFEDILSNPTKKVAEALTREQANGPATVLAQMGDEIMGTTEYLPESDKWLMTMYRNADFTTLVHEQAHVLRQMLPPEQFSAIARAYGATGKWTRAQEERFADDFVAYMSGVDAPPGLEGAFNATRAAVRSQWESAAQLLSPRNVTPEAQAFFDTFLNPEPTRVAEESVIPEFKDTGGLTPGQKVARTVPMPGESRYQALRRGIRAGKMQERLSSLATDRADLLARRKRVAASADKMRQVLNEERLPSQLEAAALDARAYRTLEKVLDNLDDPSVSSVPPAWQPVWAGIKALRQQAEISNEFAEALGEAADVTFPEVIRMAKEQGFNPAHISLMKPHQVRSLINDALRLGPELGKENAAATRKSRMFVQGGVEHSIKALGAALVAAIKEKHTNAVVDYVEEVFARPVERGADGNAVIPKGFTAWDPVRRSLTVGKEDVPLDRGLLGNEVNAAQYMIPDEVARTIRMQQKDYGHPLVKALGKPTALWRNFVLTMSPRWYVNNFVGNVALATAEGVKLQDWVKAWNSYRQREKGAKGRVREPFADVPEVRGASFVSDLEGGGESIIPRSPLVKGIREAMREGGVNGRLSGLREAGHQAADTVRRANEVVDEFARAAVFHKTLRVTGDYNAAVERSFKAMVDYHDLSPFEQGIVRAVIPFYAWQKGILKISAKLMFDNPAAMGLMMMLGQLNRDIQRDKYGTELPDAYASFIGLPGGGAINTRGINPFQDSAQILTPDGIGQSLNPFVEAAIRNALHAKETKFGGGRSSVSPFGTVQDEVPLGESMKDIALGVPQARLGADRSGENVARTFGVGYYSPEKVADIAQRTAEARAVVDKINSKSKRKSSKKPKVAGIYGGGTGGKSGSIYDKNKGEGGYRG